MITVEESRAETRGSEPDIRRTNRTRIFEPHLKRRVKGKVKPMPAPKLGTISVSTSNYTNLTLDHRFSAVQKKRDVCGGEPCVNGTRVTVRTLYELYRQGETSPQLAQVFNLQPWQVDAALEYADRNRQEIETLIQENERA
jgi:uncharacterized protein (DUF433 family)